MVSCREQLSVSIICISEFSCFLVYYCTLFSVLCISSFIHPRGFMGCPVLNIHWLLTIVSQHLSSCSALSLLERMEDGQTADFNFVFSYHNTTFHGATIHEPFLLHFRAFRFYITLCHTVKKGTVLWRCNSGLSNYKFSLNNVAFQLNNSICVRLNLWDEFLLNAIHVSLLLRVISHVHLCLWP